MNFEMITKYQFNVHSEHFKIEVSRYCEYGTDGIKIINEIDEEVELKIEWLDELIQALILFREHNVERKKESKQTIQGESND